MTDIFLSYSSKDRQRVRPIRDALVTAGYDVFWDLETPPGENWDQWIRQHLTRARVVVVFWTNNSAASVNVQHEAVIAREGNKLIPVLLETMKVHDFPMGFYTTQAALLHDWSGEATHKGYVDLLKALRERLGDSAANAEQAAQLAEDLRRANLGIPEAQNVMGWRYDVGFGVPKNALEAVRFFRLAADQGHLLAQTNLGYMYEAGRDDLAQNDREAVRLYRLAADQGHASAQGRLGLMYEAGRGGLAKDYHEAVRLYQSAAGYGSVRAKQELQRLGLT